MEKVCDAVSITLNKNTVPGDRSAFAPGGVRVGSPALTTRGFVEKDFEKVAEFLHRTLEIALKVQAATEKKDKCTVAEFVAALETPEFVAATSALRSEVHAFALSFPMPGFGSSAVTGGL